MEGRGIEDTVYEILANISDRKNDAEIHQDWNKLCNLQKQVKKQVTDKPTKFKLLNLLSTQGFEVISRRETEGREKYKTQNEENFKKRKEFASASEENYLQQIKSLDSLMEGIENRENLFFSELKKSFKYIKSNFEKNNKRLILKHKTQLNDYILKVEENLDKIEEDLDKKRKIYGEMYKKSLEIPLSRLVIPDIPKIEKLNSPKIPNLLSEKSSVDIQDWLDNYKNAFHFKSKKSEFRNQQAKFGLLAYEASQTNNDAVIEGPTGMGKTRAAISAIIPFLLKNQTHRAVFSTRTISQVENIIKDLEDVLSNDELKDITASVYIGKHRVINDLVKCYVKREDFEKKNKKRIKDGEKPWDTTYCNGGCDRIGNRFFVDKKTGEPLETEKIKRKNSGTLESINSKINVIGINELVENQHLCPIRLYEEVAKESRILVIPHNYLYDSYWKKIILGDISKVMLIIDEAHNFVSDAENIPYLTIGKKYIKNSVESEDEFFSPDNRTSNTFYLDDFITRVQDCFSNLLIDTKTTIGDQEINYRKTICYIGCIFNELKSSIESCIGIDNNLEEEKKKIIAESDLSKMILNMNKNFRTNISKLETLVENTKNKIDTFDYELKTKIVDIYYSYSQMLSSLKDLFENPYEYLIVYDGNKIEICNINPKKRASLAIDGFYSRIFTSATMSPTKEIADVLGIPYSLNSKMKPVFPEQNYKTFFVAGVNSSRKLDMKNETEYEGCFTNDEKTILHNLFDKSISSAPGKNIGIFCTSNQGVINVYNILKESSSDIIILPFIKSKLSAHKSILEEFNAKFTQAYHERVSILLNANPIHPEIKKIKNIENVYNDTNIINSFKVLGYSNKTTILLGVQGGTLSEGVDYPGKQMEMVISVGLPYPSSASELMKTKVKENYFSMIKGDKELGIDLAYRSEAFRKLAQSLGRANRKMDDKAVLICVDERLLAIKNVKESGPNRYEFLSIRNAKNNIKNLQKAFHSFNRNIILPKMNQSDIDSIITYLSPSMCKKTDFISLEDMANQIKNFYDK